MPVQAGLADQQPQLAAAELGRGLGDLLADLGEQAASLGGDRQRGAGDARRGPELTEDVPQRPGPLAGRHTGTCALQGGREEVAVARRGLLQAREGVLGAGLVAVVPPLVQRLDDACLVGGVDGHDGRVEVRGERIGLGALEAVDADDLLLVGLDPGPPLGVRGDQLRLEIAGLHRGHRAAHLLDPLDLREAVRDQGFHLGLDDMQ